MGMLRDTGPSRGKAAVPMLQGGRAGMARPPEKLGVVGADMPWTLESRLGGRLDPRLGSGSAAFTRSACLSKTPSKMLIMSERLQKPRPVNSAHSNPSLAPADTRAWMMAGEMSKLAALPSLDSAKHKPKADASSEPLNHFVAYALCPTIKVSPPKPNTKRPNSTIVKL
jgi:hypothetical protein